MAPSSQMMEPPGKSGRFTLPEYVFYLLRRASKEIEKKSQGLGVKGITRKEFGNFEIPLPSLKEQRNLVEQIEVKQKAIEHAKEVIKNLERERRYFGQSLRKLADVEWVELGDLFGKVKEQINPKGRIGKTNYVGLENIESDNGRLIGEVKASIENIKSLKNKFKRGDILYGKLRPNLNKVWVADREGICSTDIFVLRKKLSEINENIYAIVLRSDDFNKEVLKGLKGAQLPRVGFDYLSKIKIPILPENIQERFASQFREEDNAISANMKVIDMYEKNINKFISEI